MGSSQICIKDKGRLEIIDCVWCGIEFEGKVGVVTYSGPLHPPEYCDKCYKRRKLMFLASLENL
jgi:hypothetical protein